DHFAPMAMQTQNGPIYNALFNLYTSSKSDRTYKAPVSEDCLYLNVWKPSGDAPEGGWPVLVYVHGGSLMTGSSWYEK
ncbi:carboxylesterase, partial [Klebsiella pneumoniae]|nr:carboxylesterase [Klebsiella pneumoniae]